MIDANLSLSEPLAGTIRAFALLDRVSAAMQGSSRPPCERIPFMEYARIGWGLRIADDGAAPIETVLVVRDYQPLEDELAIPAVSIDVSPRIFSTTVPAKSSATLRAVQAEFERRQLLRHDLALGLSP